MKNHELFREALAAALFAIGLWITAVLCALALGGCAVTSIPVEAPTASTEQRETVSDAAQHLGYTVVWRDPGIEVVFIEDNRDAPWSGKTMQTWPCKRHIDTEDYTPVVRHELGHALGLEHTDGKFDVMNEEAVNQNNTQLSRKERRRMRVAAWWLMKVCK